MLEVRAVSKSFGSLRVIDDLSLSVERGETLGILGPNGAGKTTLFNLISGDQVVDQGQVVFGGLDISQMPPHRRCRLGIGRSYQIALPFEGLTVFENLLVGARFGGAIADHEAAADHCVDILRKTGLLHHANRLAGTLTLLDRKRLELARALATHPELILLDEIAGGLTEKEAQNLVEVVKQIHTSGVTIIWIEHVVHALMSAATRLLVINFGQKLIEGEPRAVIDSPEVRRVYMGIDV